MPHAILLSNFSKFFDKIVFSLLCSSRKYPYPPHGRDWKFWRGGGVKGLGISGEGGVV